MERFPALARPRLLPLPLLFLSYPFRSLACRAFAGREGGCCAHQSFLFLCRLGRMGSACAFNVTCGKCFESAAISELERTKGEKWCGEAGVRGGNPGQNVFNRLIGGSHDADSG